MMTKALTLDDARDALRRDAMYGVPIPEDTDPYVFMTSGDLRKALRSRDATIAGLRAQLDEKDRRVGEAAKDAMFVKEAIVEWKDYERIADDEADAALEALERLAALSQDKETSS